MHDLGEALGRRRADALRGAVSADELGKTRFDGSIAPGQRVIVGVADKRCIPDVVGPIVGSEFFGEGAQLRLRLFAA